MAQYTEQDLERCERLIDEAREKVARQHVIIDQLDNFDRLDEACSVLDNLMETLTLYEQKRARILEALTK